VCRPTVSIAKSADYSEPSVSEALNRCLNALGGLDRTIPSKSRVFVKINCLTPLSLPERAIITHPLFTREVIKMLLDLGCSVTIGDDVPSEPENIFDYSGYSEMARSLGVKIVNLKEAGFREVSLKGEMIDRTFITPFVLESDVILCLPKLKTHSLTAYTGAVKNMYGTIPHGLRLKYHHTFQDPESFSRLLVDIFSIAPPHLSIMDAVVGMEGEGPGAGKPRHLGMILASEDAVALDAAASALAGFNPLNIYTTLHAHERHLGVGEIGRIDIRGESIQGAKVGDFQHSAIAIGFLRRKIPQAIYGFISDQLTLLPRIDPEKCTSCGECAAICPTGAARMILDSAWIQPKLCIHCMCCHEVCRFQAVKLKRKPIGQIIRVGQALTRKIKKISRRILFTQR
jgi:uncharacterized protein (DUF362 family)/NAD-dependent dihydropyrimidine dehydrogenase PreA subunit